ncbi:MAG: alpha/beta hydrolase [Bacteroidetes bacterium]|nr:alpha/beta hydrolase [Bacteroidota bacterium]
MLKFIFKDKTTVYYSKAGSGFPVILLHGFGEDHRIWNQCAEALKKRYLLLLPDIPGSGKSSLLNNNFSDVSIETYADVVFELLVHEHINQCILLGHSMGGYITLAFAKKYPQKLAGFGLINSTAYADGNTQLEKRKKSIEIIQAYGPHAFLQQVLPALFAENFRETHKPFMEKYLADSKSFQGEALIQYYRAMMQRPDHTRVLQESKVPVLFVSGTDDAAAPLNDLLKQMYMPDISYIHILENGGHKSMFEAPEKLHAFIGDFIEGSISKD